MSKEVVAAAPTAEVYANQVKLFGKWNCDEVNVEDISLRVITFNIIAFYAHYAHYKLFTLGLHTDQRQSGQVSATHGRPIPGKTISQGTLSNCWAFGMFSHDARPKQRQEADGDPHR